MQNATPLSEHELVPDVEERVGQILEWLACPVAAPGPELRAAREHLAELSALSISINQYHRILDLFHARIDQVCASVKPLLHDGGLERIADARAAAGDLCALYADLCQAYLRVLNDVEHRLVRNRRRNPAAVATRALKAQRERLELTAYLAQPIPAGLWRQAYQLYREARRDESRAPAEGEGLSEAGRIYREMLVIGALQPDRLSPVEVAAAADYLSRYATVVELADQAPHPTDHRLFWLDTDQDAAPVALVRRLPPAAEGSVLFMSCTRLSTMAEGHKKELDSGAAPAELDLPYYAGQPGYRSLLTKLHETFTEPQTRQLSRRHHASRVEMRIGLESVRQVFVEASAAGRTETSMPTWIIVNESPTGFGVWLETGLAAGLASGEIVAVRRDSGKPWDICIVRWMRGDASHPVEAGLQVLASRAKAVRIGFRRAHPPQIPLPGLWLPAARALRAHNAILIPANSVVSQRFVMVPEQGRTRVAQGKVLKVDLQTPQVLVFEYQEDPYPI
jgi:hypothetical protein